MVKSLSEDLRWRIIYCQADGFTQKEIAKRLYVSEATVNKVCRIFKKWGCVKDPFAVRVGRRKIIQKVVKERSEALRGFYLYNIGINYTSEQLIFIDETAKDERTLTRLYGYSPINTRAKKSIVFVRGKRYTILPALSLEGFIAVDVMEGSCDKERFQTFILTQLVIKCVFVYIVIYIIITTI